MAIILNSIFYNDNRLIKLNIHQTFKNEICNISVYQSCSYYTMIPLLLPNNTILNMKLYPMMHVNLALSVFNGWRPVFCLYFLIRQNVTLKSSNVKFVQNKYQLWNKINPMRCTDFKLFDFIFNKFQKHNKHPHLMHQTIY